jgi:hypothetical protein
MPAVPSDRFLMQFQPAHWTPAGKFLKFLGPPFNRTRVLNEAIQSCADHTRKYETFAELAAELAPKLALDRDELESQGYSPAARSRQFAALIEVLVCELYSVLDGIRYTTFHIYRKVRGVQSGSTSKLFSKASERSYGEEFPEELLTLFDAAYRDWFLELRRLRTAFTHGGLGSCSLSQDRTVIAYINQSLGSDAIAHVIPDIVAHLNALAIAVFKLTHDFFEYHYGQLQQNDSSQFCGFYRGRGYMRNAKPEPNLAWDSGICSSRGWFDNESEYMCPLANECAAYRRAAA